MKSITFSKKSWHYQFADAGNYFPQRDENGNDIGDICEYTKAVMKFF